MITFLRWLLVPVGCYVAWWLAFIIAVLALALVESIWPHDEKESLHPSFHAAVCFGTALSAVFVVLAAFLIAPDGRGRVAWIAFAIGGLFAFGFAITTSEWAAFLTAIVAGFLAATWLSQTREPNEIR